MSFRQLYVLYIFCIYCVCILLYVLYICYILTLHVAKLHHAHVTKPLRRTVNDIKTSHAFAMVANSKKLLVGKHSDSASTASQMILDAMKNPTTYLTKWYDELVPCQSRMLGVIKHKEFTPEQVKSSLLSLAKWSFATVVFAHGRRMRQRACRHSIKRHGSLSTIQTIIHLVFCILQEATVPQLKSMA
jgi:hypothetical protein